MAYSELIKSFSKIREYMNQFYVYGFKTRSEYDKKSARSYDNERRRIESWLGDYMTFRQDSNSKNVFISVDSRTILHNPLYNAFKTKSFTDNDIMLHFYILDILVDDAAMSIREIANTISEEYSSFFENEKEIDESTLRKKLKEYEALGIIKSEKRGKELVFSRVSDNIDLESLKDVITFFSEEAPLGVVGSFLLDKLDGVPDYFSFKHHYILHATDSEIIYSLMQAINDGREASVTTYSSRSGKLVEHIVVPLKLYISTQGGRSYALIYNKRLNALNFHRIDSIKEIKLGDICENRSEYLERADRFKEHLWGVSVPNNRSIEHIEMTVLVNEGEEYIIDRLEREKRNGSIEKIDDTHYKFIADVYDTTEMLPWLRTFIGRITKLECSDSVTVDTFYSDLAEMKRIYGGDSDAF